LSQIRFGIVIPQGWRNDLPQTSARYQFKYSKDIIVAAERNGFDSVYAYDHFIPHYRYPSAGSFFECFTLLSAISLYTKKLKIGQIVTCNSYRNPALLAKMVATLSLPMDAQKSGLERVGIKKNIRPMVTPISQT
jgi:alkanesulfonate monooxygenase SsuD/methylene tetrahydromethanopterin reductase-like flavin-dependent oxidoreductase (luciferase family)